MIHPPLAHNPSALMNTAGILLIFGLLMVPLSYGCISLAGFVLGRIGSGCSLLRAGVSALICSLLLFVLFIPSGICLQFCAGGGSPME